MWKSSDLNYILDHGDTIFKTVGIPRSLFINELPQIIQIENTNIDIEMLANYFGLFGRNKIFENHLTTDIGNGLIFTTGSYSFSLVWNKKSVHLFDSYSQDINGSFTNDGTAIVLSFKYLDDVELYIRTEYSKQIANYNKSQFELQYVRVATSPANVTAILDSLKRHRNSTASKTYYQKQIGTPKHEQYKSKLRAQQTENIGTPEHEKIKKQKCEKRAKILGTLEHEEIKKTKM